MDRIPVEPLAGSLLWSWVLPAAIFALAAGATWMLYRHFAGKPGGGPR